MSVTATRYPGAQPFSDDALSRKIFFGREREVTALTDQILANRMVVVYARSGIGKSSLLNAGVAQRLRDEDFLPLIVRVNDVQDGPRASVLRGISAATERQGTEYIAGDPVSLWSFFKTAEFWRGDLLVTPVLIIDQFEELFTLQGSEARMNFLSELSYLVRGVPPPNFAEAHPDLSDAAPAVRVVLSLREDCLGLLEEAADRIPQILDHRFRLTPLSVHAAAEALTGPAAIDDPALETRPFRYDPKAVESILDYLSRRYVRTLVETSRNIEPFQLQLICQRFERIAVEWQRQSADNVTLTIKDIGGEAALRGTLKDFYRHAVAALPGRRARKAARQLCENFLISPEGRRLSLEESEIRRQLRLSSETLGQLVSNRLLRSDSRANSIYYELSHDALVEPVLATRRAGGLLFGSLGLFAGGLSWLVTGIGLLFVIYFLVALIVETSPAFFGYDLVPHWAKGAGEEPGWGGFIVLLLAAFGTFAFSKMIFSGGLQTLRRYLRRKPVELIEPTTASTKDLLFGWLAVVGGCLWLSLCAIILIFVVILLGSTYLGGGPPEWTKQDFPVFYEHGPQLDVGVYVAGALALLSLGIDTVKWGYRRLRPFRQPTGLEQPIAVQRRSRVLLSGYLRIVGGGIALLAVMFVATELLANVECYSRGSFPGWVPARWWSLTNFEHCQAHYGDWATFISEMLLNVIFSLGLLASAVNCLLRGVRAVLNHFHNRLNRSLAG